MVFVHGLGHFHPENVMDNAFFESLDIGTNDEWIVSRVGIHERRTVLPLEYIRQTKNADLRAAEEAALYSNAQTGARAAELAIERAGISKEDIGMIMVGGCSPRHCIPAEASTIAHELGIECPAIELSAACSTFGLHLHMVSMLGPNAPDYVLSVTPENTSRVTDYADRSSCVLFGDATAAAVLSTKHRARASVGFTKYDTSPSGAYEVVVPRTGHFFQKGSRVQKFAIKKMTALLRECVEHAADDNLVYVGHQANLAMLTSVVKRAKLEPSRHWFNIDKFGNQFAAGAPAVLSQRWDSIEDGTHVAMVVVGSGLSWARAIFSFD